MCQLRSDILYTKKQVDIKNTENKYRRSNIAIPIQPYNLTSEEENVREDENTEQEIINNIVFSDDEKVNESNLLDNNESDAINSTEQWANIMQNWMDMVNNENHLENENVDPLEFVAVDRTIHPADDPLSKWNLSKIFNNSLIVPVFINELTSLD